MKERKVREGKTESHCSFLFFQFHGPPSPLSASPGFSKATIARVLVYVHYAVLRILCQPSGCRPLITNKS